MLQTRFFPLIKVKYHNIGHSDLLSEHDIRHASTDVPHIHKFVSLGDLVKKVYFRLGMTVITVEKLCFDNIFL